MLSQMSSSLLDVTVDALAGLERPGVCDQPPGALAAGRALAAGLVLVELVQRSVARTTEVVSSKTCSALVPSIEPRRADALVVQGHVEVLSR